MVITENNGFTGTIQPKLKSQETHFTWNSCDVSVERMTMMVILVKKIWTKSGTLSQSKRRQLAGDPSCSMAEKMNKCTSVQNGFNYLLWLRSQALSVCFNQTDVQSAQTQWPRFPCVEVRRRSKRRRSKRSKRSRKSDSVKERKFYCKQDWGV